MIRIAFAALLALVLFPLPALAASTTVDFSGIVEPLVSGVFAVIGAAIVWLARKGVSALESKLDIELDDQLANRLDHALIRAVTYGETKAVEMIKRHGVKEVDFRSELLAAAAQYATDSVPDALRYFDIDQARLIQMIEARVGVDLDADGFIGKPEQPLAA